jgi:Zn finger protein HypA/HybF involved in hydrogenase expression
MPWAGGNCPGCGEYMPPRQVHCRHCLCLLGEPSDSSAQWERRYLSALINPNGSGFSPLKEIDAAHLVLPVSYLISCPKCKSRLRAGSQSLGKKVRCGSCKHELACFAVESAELIAVYVKCALCDAPVRVTKKYLAQSFDCPACAGRNLVELPGERTP